MLKRGRDADHLSPGHWKGNLRASSCNIKECWDEGIALAVTALKKYRYPFDILAHFDNWRASNIDLLRPLGGKYPGISSEVDRSLADTQETQISAENLNLDAEDTFEFRSFDGVRALAAEALKARSTGLVEPYITLENGVKVHKKTVIRVSVDPHSDFKNPTSHEHLARVQ
ncbi:hypothetical protein FA15DRAFT_606519, partial [Coprinopsis marcescibilis]